MPTAKRVWAWRRCVKTHPLASLLPCDNVFAIESRWYRDNPLVIRGPGAGRDVTAGAIQSDINRLAQLL